MTDQNLFQKINAIRKEASRIVKDVRVAEGGGYMAVSHDQITDKIRELEIKYGVLCYASLKSGRMIDTGRQSRNGIPMMRYEAVYTVTFRDCDRDGAIETDVEAHALDFGDKAPGKALSYAVKYATLKMYRLVTGDQDEERPEAESVVATITEDQQQELAEKLRAWYGGNPDPAEAEKAVQGAEKRLTRFLVDQYGKGATPASIPQKDFERVLSVLERNRPPEGKDA